MQRSSERSGFTLIELLVVMAIIATLASLGIVGIPAFLRRADITADQAKLKAIFQYLQDYQTQHKALSPRSGPSFVLSIWDSGQVDKTQKDAEIFFAATTGRSPDADFENVSPEGIDWTGPDQSDPRRPRMRIQDRNANDKVIICNKCPTVTQDSDLDLLPYAAKGLCYLMLGGASGYVEASEFGDYPVIGPASENERFKNLVVDE